jgi:hypothetical protein
MAEETLFFKSFISAGSLLHVKTLKWAFTGNLCDAIASFRKSLVESLEIAFSRE